jgi:hypothetical protein
MDNREVLVKLQYTTKYGIELHSSRVLRNFLLYKYLVLKHVSEQVYIDYSNEDCEIVNLKELFNNSVIITNKTKIDSYNNLKELMYKNSNNQYDLFVLIDNAYNDVFSYYVENDLSFEKYTYFYKKLLLLSKNLMNNYTQYIGTEKFPKDMNHLFEMELGEQKFNQLVEWMLEPILNDSNINCLINTLLNQIGMKQLSVSSQSDIVPCHINATQRFNDTLNKPVVDMKEKVIITKNQQGYYTFKDLIFNLKTSVVIGKWNSKTMTMDKLSNDDINICKKFNLKYDEQRVETKTQNDTMNNSHPFVKNIFQNINLENKNDTVQITNEVIQKHESEKNTNETNTQIDIQGLGINVPQFDTVITENLNEVLNQLNKEVLNDENEPSVGTVVNEPNTVDTETLNSQVDGHAILDARTDDRTVECSDLSRNLVGHTPCENEDLSSINPNTISFVPLCVNDKVSKTTNRKRTTITSSNISLKQKLAMGKTGK